MVNTCFNLFSGLNPLNKDKKRHLGEIDIKTLIAHCAVYSQIQMGFVPTN